jgi:hypothetical protein
MRLKDDAEPTAVETLVGLLCELREDIEALRDRHDNKPLSMAHMRKQRARRWEQTLAAVQGAIDERVAYALQRRAGASK